MSRHRRNRASPISGFEVGVVSLVAKPQFICGWVEHPVAVDDAESRTSCPQSVLDKTPTSEAYPRDTPLHRSGTNLTATNGIVG